MKKLIIGTILLTAFLVLANSAQAASLYSNASATLTQSSATSTSTTIDASGYENLVFSFSYEAESLDNGDSFTYGWSSDGVDNILGTVNGINEGGEAGDETGTINAPIPAEAQAADLTLFIHATVNSGDDDVILTDIALSGDVVPVVVATIDGTSYESLQDAVDAANPEGGDVIELDKDITLSQQVTISKPVMINGNGHTIFAPFAKTDNSNNSALGVSGVDGEVVISNLTIDGTGSTGSRHGVNVYESANVTLSDVTIKNNSAAALIVNGSTVTALNLTTEGNVWGAVNVDPGSGVILPSVFTLNSGALSEDTQIWSDGAHVTEEAIVTVNADGYGMYSLTGTPIKYWLNKAPVNAAYIGNTLYSTIQEAINAATTTPDAVVNVGSGSYDESVLIETPVTLRGTGDTKPVISGTDGTAYVLKVNEVAGSVTLDNLEINGGDTNSFDYGLWVSGSGTNATPVEIENSVVKNIWNPGSNGIEIDASSYALVHDSAISSFHKRGIRFIDSSGKFYDNEITGDNVDGTSRVQNLVNLWGGSDVEIYGNDLHNALTDGETPTWDSPAIFVSSYGGSGDSHADIHDNEIYNSDTGVVITSVYADADASDATITDNYFRNLNWAINFEKETGSASVDNNKFENVNAAINAEASGDLLENPPVVSAENNWWGTTIPSEIDALLIDTVDFDPWYINASRTVLSNAVSGSTITATQDVGVDGGSEGEAVLPAGVTELVLGDSTVLDLSLGSVINGSKREVTLQSGTSDAPVIIKNSAVPSVSATIPDGTKISGPTSWDGKIEPPKAEAASGDAPAGFSVGSTVISVGSPDGTLLFSDPVTLVLGGVTGSVGYKPAGSSTWVEITEQCDGDYTSPGNPSDSEGECYISNGTDTKIVTYHFTTFGNLIAASVSTPRASRSGGSGQFAPSATAETAVAAVQAGEVLGAALLFPSQMGIGSSGQEVLDLQARLQAEGYFKATPTGYFGPITQAAVKAYQAVHGISATGFVGPLTLASLNSTSETASATPAANPQIAAVKAELISLIQQLISELETQVAAAIKAEN